MICSVWSPPYFILIGDFNGKSPRWGSDHSDIQGKIIEDVLDELDLCVLNSDEATYCSPQGTLSHLDLAICDPTLFLDFNWKPHEDLCGSDHFPIFLSVPEPQSEEPTPYWKFNKANWDLFLIDTLYFFWMVSLLCTYYETCYM